MNWNEMKFVHAFLNRSVSLFWKSRTEVGGLGLPSLCSSWRVLWAPSRLYIRCSTRSSAEAVVRASRGVVSWSGRIEPAYNSVCCSKANSLWRGIIWGLARFGLFETRVRLGSDRRRKFWCSICWYRDNRPVWRWYMFRPFIYWY